MRSSLRYAFISFLARHPALFSSYYHWHPRYARLMVRPDSELVIEGFPRCANTFAVLAFERAQDRPVRIAHHLHAPSQIELGVRYGLPVLVLIREPVGAVASLITRHPEITVDQALGQYGCFYRYVDTCRDNVVVADFREITTDFAKGIRQLNERFDASFQPYVNSQERDASVFAEIDQLNLDNEGGNALQLARPSRQKKARLQEISRQVGAHSSVPGLKALYERLVA